MKLHKFVFITAMLALAGCAGMIRDQIYAPSTLAQTPVTFKGAQPQEMQVTTKDGLTLIGYYWPATNGDTSIVVYFHGNGNNALVGAGRAEPLTANGHAVLVASYRGYGDNPGKPSETGLFTDADAWMAKARALSPNGKVFLFGHSMGGAVALEMAGRSRVDGVVTLGTFTSLRDAAPGVAKPFLPDRYDNRAAIARVNAPILLIHGTNDAIIPYDHAAQLVAASGGKARLLTLPDAGHHVDLELLTTQIFAEWGLATRQ
jgi:uncharacterized protein